MEPVSRLGVAPPTRSPVLTWTTVLPVAALVVLAATWGRHLGTVLTVVDRRVLLAAAVLAAVHHAEVVAHRVGEPFGSLVLAVAVTDHRGGADRHPHGLRRRRTTDDAGPRHRLRRGDDHLQRDRRPVAAAGRAALRPRRVQRGGHRRRAGHRRDPRDAEPGAADLHHQPPGPGVLQLAAGLRRVASLSLYGAVRADPDRPAPRLLPARRQTASRSRTTSTPSRRPPGRRSSASACCSSPWSRSSGWPRWSRRPSSPASPRSASRQSFVGVVIALLVLLPETIAAVRRRPAQPRADQPQPGLRLGDGQHRPDHPGDRRRLDLAGRPAAPGPRRRPRWCCWPSPSSSAC